MRSLLDGTLAPLTYHIGFLEVPLPAVVDEYVRWQRMILNRVARRDIALPLREAILQLPPIDGARSRVLFQQTTSSWTACFTNNSRGGDMASVIAVLAERLPCRGLTCTSIPNTLSRKKGTGGTWGAVTFTLYAPHPTDWLNVERNIRLANDVGGWEFSVYGTPQPFEELANYERSPRPARFTPEMLEQYARALGVAIFDDQFYSGSGAVIDSSSWFTPLVRLLAPGQPEYRGHTLEEARRRIGIV